jgi:hypothetical protein
MSHWHDTMVDKPEANGAVYATGWIGHAGRDRGGLGVRDLATPLKRFTGRQLGLVCAWRCRAQGAPDGTYAPLRRGFC